MQGGGGGDGGGGLCTTFASLFTLKTMCCRLGEFKLPQLPFPCIAMQWEHHY